MSIMYHTFSFLFYYPSCFSVAFVYWNNTLRDFGWFLLTAQAVIRHRPSRETFISFPVSCVVNVLFYPPHYLPVACGYWNHPGPDLWLMTESGTSSLLPSAAPGTFIISPFIHHPSHCPTATLVPLYFSLLYRSYWISSFSFAIPWSPHWFYQVQI
mgnify:CR=1 FL=1